VFWICALLFSIHVAPAATTVISPAFPPNIPTSDPVKWVEYEYRFTSHSVPSDACDPGYDVRGYTFESVGKGGDYSFRGVGEEAYAVSHCSGEEGEAWHVRQEYKYNYPAASYPTASYDQDPDDPASPYYQGAVVNGLEYWARQIFVRDLPSCYTLSRNEYGGDGWQITYIHGEYLCPYYEVGTCGDCHSIVSGWSGFYQLSIMIQSGATLPNLESLGIPWPYQTAAVGTQDESGNVPPLVWITGPTNGTILYAPASLTLTASATDVDGTVNNVKFYDGTTLLNTDTTPPYSFNWNDVPFGIHTLTAKATDNNGLVTTSDPVKVTVSSSKRVSAGGSHTLAVKTDGTVWAWGDDSADQLGILSWSDHSSPVQVDELTNNIIAVAAGGYHSLALGSDGKVWAWGLNVSGQTGDDYDDWWLLLPDQAYISGVIGIAAGYDDSLAVKYDGTVWQWGNGVAWHPVQVSGISGAVAVASGYSHSLALTTSGNVWAWGGNGYGQLGNGTTTSSSTPVQVANLSGIVAIAAARNNSYALKTNGTVWAWGRGSGLNGDGTTTVRTTPVQVHSLSNIVAISAGQSAGYALKSDGSVWSWGINNQGQLGNGSTSGPSDREPHPITDSNNVLPQGAIGLAGGGSDGQHFLVIAPDLTLRSWGLNADGQLGDDSTTRRTAPVTLYNGFGL
jgi:alpha-tubulin suppressor-like RCC1 family protein